MKENWHKALQIDAAAEDRQENAISGERERDPNIGG
jgi:hypothetical protein